MRPFKRAENAVIESATGAGRTVSVAVTVAAAAVLLLVGVLVGVLVARS